MAIEATTVESTLSAMTARLGAIMPLPEIRSKAELVFEILRLKKERGAIILGHNYMEPALFLTIPDVVGDSLELSREAARTDKNPIVFCGVRFMAETAKILNPSKTVLLPAKVAGCSLAASITAADVRELRAQYPGVPIVTYINTYADVKAECDVCCTSGNAARVVRSLNSDTIIFLPDEYLARNVAEETGKRILFPAGNGAPGLVDAGTKESAGSTRQQVMIGWRGRCEVHEKFSVEDIQNARRQFPDVVVLAHPECSPEVVHASDYSASTTKMADFVKSSSGRRFLLLTECSMADNIIAENPGKEMVRMCSIRCPHMNEITLEDTLHALRHNQYEITVDEQVAAKARLSLERMLTI